MLEAVIFDFDGVIADTPKYYFRHMKGMLKKHSDKISDEEISHLIGYRLEDKLAEINRRHGLKVAVSDFLAQTQKSAKGDICDIIAPDSGLKPLLIGLKSCGIAAGIASNNSSAIIHRVISNFCISEYFGAVVSGDDVSEYKPSPAVYLRAAELLDVSPKKCVGIEDTVIGVASAKSAGMKAVAMPNEYSASHDFGQADLIIRDFKELSAQRLMAMVK